MLTFPGNIFSNDKDKKEKSKISSLEKSILIPGWGQLSEKHYVEGFIFLTLEAGAIAGIIINARKANEYYKYYKEAKTIPDAVKYRELTEKYDIKRNKFILAAGVIWALNLLDMYFIYKKKNKNLFILFGNSERNGYFIKIIKYF
ncbi:hypothetical protein NLD30_05200 [SCandidatus Aminicenantes bacterium Aminicenantia_JdfR_composite]|jgi:hypothetical protein|nr:hypothetical protein [SCandidatus Aminicenantes bacterium Aminicenantia_JdfR_composite]